VTMLGPGPWWKPLHCHLLLFFYIPVRLWPNAHSPVGGW